MTCIQGLKNVYEICSYFTCFVHIHNTTFRILFKVNKQRYNNLSISYSEKLKKNVLDSFTVIVSEIRK